MLAEWLMPSLFKSVGGMVLSALVSVAVEQTIGERVESIRGDRRKKKAFTRAVSRAHRDFKRHCPELAASFFDEHFIRKHGVHELKLLLAPTGEPNAERLAEAFAQQFGQPIAGIREPAAGFIRFLEGHLVAEPELRDLIGFRRLEQTYRSVKRIEDTLFLQQALQPPSPIELNRSAVDAAFGRASTALLGWPQLSAGQWIERPEIEKLRKTVSSPESPIAILVGPPGGGKSALLARLGTELADGGWALLAIKADQLPAGIDSLDRLDHHFRELGAPASVMDCLQALAAEQPVALLIDQLDALSELMDRQTGRLSALLALVHCSRGIKGLSIVLSSREVEYRHDARLASLDAEPVILENPRWEDVNHVLSEAGVDTSRWPAETRETLRNVEHLNVFLRYFADDPTAPVFDTYLSMLETVFQARVNTSGEDTAEFAYEVAGAMAESEELWVARARFERRGDAIERLLAAGLLRTTPNAKGIGFRHQTMFEFVRARDFARGHASLADWVLSRQEAVQVVRPVLWKALPYLRDADPGRYVREVARLWNAEALRPHLRWILITFLGGLHDPRNEEARWLLSLFDREDRANLRRKALMAMTGSPGWLGRLRSRLPALMSGPPAISRPTSVLLARALSFDAATVFDLINRHWAGRPERRPELDNVLWDVQSWDADWTRLAAALLADPETPPHSAHMLVRRAAKIEPVRAAQLLAAKVCADSERIRTNPPELPEPPPPGAPEEEQVVGRWKREDAARKPYRTLLTGEDWYGVPDAARQAPKAFLDQLWPTVTKAAEALARPQQVVGYRESRGLLYDFEKARDRSGCSLLAILLSAVETYAESDADGFCDFVLANESSDLALVHSFLARGLMKIAEKAPHAALAYLLEAPERLAVGDMHDMHAETRRLISAVGPHLSVQEMQQLERSLVSYQYYQNNNRPLSAAEQRDFIRWNRAHRLRLLRAIPENRCSPRVRRLLLEEERALPGLPDWDMGPIEVSWRGSPMSADQMDKANDRDIIRFFETLDDDPDEPGKRKSGGDRSLAARAFAEFAKKRPERGFALLDRFTPQEQGTVVGLGVHELSGVEALDPDRLVSKIHELADRGLAAQEGFREGAAWALEKLALRREGLESSTCELLESWLRDAERQADSSQLEDGGPTSILWTTSTRIVPGGNYPILRALMLGYLCRPRMDADGWLHVLERHLARREDPRVWGGFDRDLRYLANANRDQAVAFMETLLGHYPELLSSEDGVRLVAHTHWWLPPSVVTTIFDTWCSAQWVMGPQAAGEVIVLRYAQMPEDAWTTQRLAILKEGVQRENICIGMAYSAAHLWGDAQFRSTMMPMITELIGDASAPVADALFEVFRVNESPPVDEATRLLLQAIASHPYTLDSDCTFLVVRLKSLLFDAAFVGIIAQILDALVDRKAQQIADISTGWAADADHLMQCALTLQRFSETREVGVAIFERLIELGAYSVDRVLHDIDRRIA